MGKLILKAENISKHYRLGNVGATTLKQDLYDFFKKKITFKGSNKSPVPDAIDHPNDIWALRDINLEVFEGDVLGFVGKNGSGKSTLLKILSRISHPTTGVIKGRGRIASLLEVGTGFHAELTGRENIYLNGQILGLNTRQINERFDRIVDFSGIEKFLDTPVKRYSSGMYVRLAFAVAAHMEADIMIIDEVLAVGDSEYQMKCLAKMKEISKEEGKTVLFVSHNMQTIRNLCNKALYLDKGRVADIGHPDLVVSNYLRKEQVEFLYQQYEDQTDAPGNKLIKIKEIELVPDYMGGPQKIRTDTPLTVSLEFWYTGIANIDLAVSILLFTFSGDCIFDVRSAFTQIKPGLIKGECLIPANFLNDGSYYVSLAFVNGDNKLLYEYDICLSFEVEDAAKLTNWYGKWLGFVRPEFTVDISQKEISS
jgi:lipopolysaccharide transport system ATP-binding protein